MFRIETIKSSGGTFPGTNGKPMLFQTATLLCLLLPLSNAAAALLENHQHTLRVEIQGTGPDAEETISIKTGHGWTPALSVTGSSMLIHAQAGAQRCAIKTVLPVENGLLVTGNCGLSGFEQHIMLTPDEDTLAISSRIALGPGASLRSVEDRYRFVPERHSDQTAQKGPLDFVWSQNIKSEADDFIPTYGFKSPAVMLQQGEVFVALLPDLSSRKTGPLALDLDVTSDTRPWIAYGAIPAQPHGHSYFRRAPEGGPAELAGFVEYSYAILASRQPERLGYRRVVRWLWRQYGHPALLDSPDMQQNVIRPELASFRSWQQEAWVQDANQIYSSFDCDGKVCGTLKSNRNDSGDWAHSEPDAWFNAWFQTLRTAYGWYIYGKEAQDRAVLSKAESILTLALSAPQKDGAFPTIYLVKSHTWIADDGWAGYQNDYHAFCMSWTAYWILRWAEDLVPRRKPEIFRFLRPYADFLLRQQLPSGVVPSWYELSSLRPRPEFRDFNAETVVSALFLASFGAVTGERKYISAAERAMDFITERVVPRQRWYDFETFLSCARKNYDFYDPWTAQFPQNNLAEIQAPEAWLALYHATNRREDLDNGVKALDYLLLTQQVWSNPLFSPKLLGGFTTQNTDAEWSDARQGYAAVVLFDYYRATGDFEYLERAVAAARASFAVAPWENWAHTGYKDEPGALTGFHWGTGSAMTSIEIMAPLLGDAYIDLKSSRGVGFDECTVRNVRVSNGTIAFDLESSAQLRTFLVHFAGVDPARQYSISWNGRPAHTVSGKELQSHGYRVGPVHSWS
ncbi:hypothetical protein [Pseudacidobacterium ailaaui]|uniref:hypothetical protein n=1 Tax=Pseudacidobacterium ailaaui TaxID=1382359 RepID=UPI000A955376|nr:hypothetical protein [Pseudacidobacterium ailaaui]